MSEPPYTSIKMLGGAYGDTFVFFNPENRLKEDRFTHGKESPFEDQEWTYYLDKIMIIFQLANIDIYKKKGSEFINVNGKMVELIQENFRKILPKSGLKGYESY